MSDFFSADLALGWGRMSDQSVIDQFDIKQRRRWYLENKAFSYSTKGNRTKQEQYSHNSSK
jgi:hypothetical protein